MSRINNQIQHRISCLTKLGVKKKEAQKEAREIYLQLNGSLKGYNPAKTYIIRSIGTAKAYRECGRLFADWLKEVKGINKINLVTPEVAGEYLKYRDGYCSAWTVKKDLAAINKIFNYELKSRELGLRDRKLTDIKRSRKGPDAKRLGILLKCKEQILLIRATGCRRQSVTVVKYSDVVFENGIAVSISLIEKGGRPRIAPILKQYQIEFTELVNKFSSIPDKNMFDEFDNHVAAHFYRAQYAKELYKETYDEIHTERNKTYKGYDKEVLQVVTEALGHNRINVVVDHYLY